MRTNEAEKDDIGMRKTIEKVILVLILVALSLITGCEAENQTPTSESSVTYSPVESGYTYTEFNQYETSKEAIDLFVSRYFMEDGAVNTNLIADLAQGGDLAQGNEQLSESMGLLMQYALQIDNQQRFNQLFLKLESDFKNQNGLYAWRINVDQMTALESVNASIDDLRIIKMLFYASEQWDTSAYDDVINRLSDSLLDHCIQGGLLTPYDDADEGEFAPLVYYDLKALHLLADYDSRWQDVYDRGLNLIFEASGDLPFFEVNASGAYGSIENFIIVQHLAEDGWNVTSYIDFLASELRSGALYGSYSIGGDVVYDIESPAVYGIVALIGKTTSEEKLYQMACEKLMESQHTKGLYQGGFVELDSSEAYSFDQLYALVGM